MLQTTFVSPVSDWSNLVKMIKLHTREGSLHYHCATVLVNILEVILFVYGMVCTYSLNVSGPCAYTIIMRMDIEHIIDKYSQIFNKSVVFN